MVFHQLAPQAPRGRDLLGEIQLAIEPRHSPQALVEVERVPRVATRAMPLVELAMEVPGHRRPFWAQHTSLEAVVEVARMRENHQPRRETVVSVVVVVEPQMSRVEQEDWVAVTHWMLESQATQVRITIELDLAEQTLVVAVAALATMVFQARVAPV